MDMCVDAAGGQDHAFASDDLRAGTDLEQRIDTVHDVAVTSLANRADEPVLDAHVGFDHAPVVKHHHVGNDDVRCIAGHALTHAIADNFATTKASLFTIDIAVGFDFQPQVGVSQPNAVAGGRTEVRDV